KTIEDRFGLQPLNSLNAKASSLANDFIQTREPSTVVPLARTTDATVSDGRLTGLSAPSDSTVLNDVAASFAGIDSNSSDWLPQRKQDKK
ncbi:MAG: hypothetical protein JO252_28985, partial [Planctomycetaceae bacterium]|nr:hypothetical protein [Planctomycetaceae bacterium]